MTYRRIALIAVTVLLISAPVVAQNQVGSILTIRGDVELDAFGTGAFIPAMEDDTLYQSSVVRTDYDSTAVLQIAGEEVTVAPLTTTPVQTIVARQSRGGLRSFVGRLLEGIASSLSGRPSEEVAVAGGRASEYAGSGSTWSFGQDVDALYEDAITAAEEGDHQRVVELLRLIDVPDEGSFDVEDFYVQLAFSQMQLGDFYGALNTAFEFAYVEPTPAGTEYLTSRLQLLAGISAYYVDRPMVAAAALDRYLKDGVQGAAPEAIRVRLELHQAAGEETEGWILREAAQRAYPGMDWAETEDR